MILPKSEIKRLIEKEGMITYYKNFDEQLQPNGFDLTLDKVYSFDAQGIIFVGNKNLPKLIPVKPDIRNGVSLYNLSVHQTYAFEINETIKLPLNVCAMTIQRSSVMRCGVTTNIGFWDSGYHGKGYSTLNILNPCGFIVERDSRIMQMVFMKNTELTEGYHGQYQFEGIKE